MPELPEVETIRRGLSKRIVGKQITAVEVRNSKVVRTPLPTFRRALINHSFSRIARRGKLLVFTIKAKETYAICHLKMTGQLIYIDAHGLLAGGHSWPPVDADLPSRFTQVIFTFADNSKLFFNDMRLFGYWQIIDAQHLARLMQAYGPEPLLAGFTQERFRAALAGRTTTLKAVLLNQAIIAGIGNIYADEICFLAGVRPLRRVNRLTQAELAALYRATKQILAKAVAIGGTTFRHFRNAAGGQGSYMKHLKVYGRSSQKCLRCKTGVIKKIKAAGRGTAFCPVCQK